MTLIKKGRLQTYVLISGATHWLLSTASALERHSNNWNLKGAQRAEDVNERAIALAVTAGELVAVAAHVRLVVIC